MKCDNDLWERSMQHVVLICQTLVPNYIKIFPSIRELQPWHKWLHIDSQAACVPLTFEVGVWFFMWHTVLICKSCVNLLQNPSMHKKVTVWTQMVQFLRFKCGLEIGQDTPSWYIKHFSTQLYEIYAYRVMAWTQNKIRHTGRWTDDAILIC